MTDRVNVKQLADEIAQQPTDDNSHLWRKGDALDDTRRAVTVAMNMHSDSDGIIPHIAGMVERGEIKPFSDFGRPPVSFAKFAECPADWFISTDDANQVKEFFRQSKPADARAAKVEAVRLPVATQQNDAILSWLKESQHDPLKLPVPPSGKAGLKKLCRDALCKSSKQLFSSTSVFDTAWERLRANKNIQDAK